MASTDTPADYDFCPRCRRKMRVGESLCPACEAKAQRTGDEPEDESRYHWVKFLALMLAAAVLSACVLISLFGWMFGF